MKSQLPSLAQDVICKSFDLGCITIIVFLTNALPITPHSSPIIFNLFRPSVISNQADFDFDLRRITTLITMSSVSFISARQQTRINKGGISKYFSKNPTKGK